MPSLQEVLAVSVVLCLAVTGSHQTAQSQNSTQDASSRRQRRSTAAGANPYGQLQTLVNGLEMSGMNTDMYLSYTPSTPAPHNINCYIETKVTRGGRCVQMGPRGRPSTRRLWMCQAGIDLGISPDCPPPTTRRSPRGRSG